MKPVNKSSHGNTVKWNKLIKVVIVIQKGETSYKISHGNTVKWYKLMKVVMVRQWRKQIFWQNEKCSLLRTWSTKLRRYFFYPKELNLISLVVCVRYVCAFHCCDQYAHLQYALCMCVCFLAVANTLAFRLSEHNVCQRS